MTNTRTMTRTTANSNITHQLLKKRPAAIVIAAKDTYIGLRVNRYGPEMTSAVAGRMGTIDVRERRKLLMLLTASARPASASVNASTLMAAPSPTASGHSRFST